MQALPYRNLTDAASLAMQALASKRIPGLTLASMQKFAASVHTGKARRGIPAQQALHLSHSFLAEQVPVRAARMVLALPDAARIGGEGMKEGLHRLQERYGRLALCGEKERTCEAIFRTWLT
jgi:hypothetical protein